MKKWWKVVGFALIAASTTGCVLLAGAGAGYMIHDEATENDGNFDPLEKARGKDDGKN